MEKSLPLYMSFFPFLQKLSVSLTGKPHNTGLTTKPTHIHESVSQWRVALFEQGQLVRVAEEHLAHRGGIVIPRWPLRGLPKAPP